MWLLGDSQLFYRSKTHCVYCLMLFTVNVSHGGGSLNSHNFALYLHLTKQFEFFSFTLFFIKTNEPNYTLFTDAAFIDLEKKKIKRKFLVCWFKIKSKCFFLIKLSRDSSMLWRDHCSFRCQTFFFCYKTLHCRTIKKIFKWRNEIEEKQTIRTQKLILPWGCHRQRIYAIFLNSMKNLFRKATWNRTLCNATTYWMIHSMVVGWWKLVKALFFFFFTKKGCFDAVAHLVWLCLGCSIILLDSVWIGVCKCLL